jgi:type II secretory pathway component PulJ
MNHQTAKSRWVISASSGRRRAGYTLVEILVATALTLVLMAAVMEMFKRIGDAINNSRAVLEMAEQLRGAAATLGRDLEGVTVVPQPPRRPELGDGYLQIQDNGGADLAGDGFSGQSDRFSATIRSTTRPFIDANGQQSDLAEVTWYLNGGALHRRVVPLVPGGATLADYTTPATRPAAPANASDLILMSNVVGFDIKVWDPTVNTGTTVGAYVDLGKGATFAGGGKTYDTWSTSGGTANAPFAASLRGIQVKIRAQEPVSNTVREVTLVQDFLPK